MCLTTADATGRYFLGSPVRGAYEITESYLMPVSFFFALCYAYRKGGSLIRVTFLVDHLPGYVKIILNHIVQVTSIFYGAILTLGTGRRAFCAIGKGTTLGNLDLPLWPAHVIVFVGLLSLTLLMLVDIFRVRHGKGCLFQADSSASAT